MNYPTKDSIFLQVQKAANKFAAIVAIFAAVVLAGCGGGGSGLSLDTNDNLPLSSESTEPTASGASGASAAAYSAAFTAANTASANFGTQESITQSSGGNDRVNATVIVNEGQLEVEITNDGENVAWSGITSTASDVESRNGILGSSDSSARLTRVFNEGRLDIDVWASSVTSTPAADYLVGGVWLYLSNTGSYEVGSFADGVGISVDMSKFNSAAAGGEATYIGTANGIRLIGADVSYFEADVNLTVAFGDTSNVSGRITGGGLPVLLLEPSDISLSGQFTGTFTAVGAVVDSVTVNYTGTWGGNFYGSTGDAVAGIFGGGDGGVNNFRGWFGAENSTVVAATPVTPPVTNPVIPPVTNLVTNAFTAANTASANFGTQESITQSSGGNDRVNATVIVNEGQLEVEITNDGENVAWSGITSTASDVESRNGILGSSDSSARLTRVFNEGRLDTDVWALSVISTNADDYLVGGVWLYLSNTGSLEVGSFADGVGIKVDMSKFNSAAAGGEATYIGTANGVRLIGADVSYFEADVNLTVAFGDTSNVSGRITGGGLPVLVLEPSDISSGQFTGEFTAEGDYTGTWGGNFYGSTGQAVAGIFGGGNGDGNNFRGWFGAVDPTVVAPPLTTTVTVFEMTVILTMDMTTTVTNLVTTTVTTTTTVTSGTGSTVTMTTTTTMTMTMTVTNTVMTTVTNLVTTTVTTTVTQDNPIIVASPVVHDDLSEFYDSVLNQRFSRIIFAAAANATVVHNAAGSTQSPIPDSISLVAANVNADNQLEFHIANVGNSFSFFNIMYPAEWAEISTGDTDLSLLNVGKIDDVSFTQVTKPITLGNGVIQSPHSRSASFIRFPGDGALHMNVFASSITATPRENDYLVGGVWLLTYETGVLGGVGAFASAVGIENFDNASAATYASVNTSATYNGKANGVRWKGTGVGSGRSGSVDYDIPSYFSADVVLDVVFGTMDWLISGNITNGPGDFPDIPLNAATIDQTTGAFNGTTGDRINPEPGTLTEPTTRERLNGDGTPILDPNTGQPLPPLVIPGQQVPNTIHPENDFIGQWGGKLYGEDGRAVSGTFGISKGRSNRDNDHIIGIFGAERE